MTRVWWLLAFPHPDHMILARSGLGTEEQDSLTICVHIPASGKAERETWQPLF